MFLRHKCVLSGPDSNSDYNKVRLWTETHDLNLLFGLQTHLLSSNLVQNYLLTMVVMTIATVFQSPVWIHLWVFIADHYNY